MAGTSGSAQRSRQQEWGILIAYFSLPVLMLVTQLLVQKMAQPSKASGATQDPQARMMNQMMFFMPIMFAWITLGLPSGLTLYWTVSNILALIQQYFVTGWGASGRLVPLPAASNRPGQAQPALATAERRAAECGRGSEQQHGADGKTSSAGASSGGARPVTATVGRSA